jgi:protein-disulfide isomerase
MKQRTLFLAAVSLLIVVFVVATIGYKSEQADRSAQRAEQKSEHLARMHSPTLGVATAPVVIVEFLDPACETCRAFYPLVKEMMAANPDKIRLVLRYAPFHNGSDQVVAMLEAARKQGKFWPALEALLATQAEWTINHTSHVDLAWKQLEGIGLDFDQLRADMMTPAVAQVIQQDLDDAAALNDTKTPEFFVNGRPLPSFGYDQLKSLVDQALSTTRS